MNKERLAKLMERFPVTELSNGNIRTCPVRLDFVHLFKPTVSKKYPNQAPRFSTSLLFPKGSDLSVLEKAMEREAEAKFGAKWRNQKVSVLLLDQGEDGSRDEDGRLGKGYAPGAKMLRCTTGEDRPPVVKFRDKDTDATPDQAYAGVWALVTVRPHGSDHGKKQVSCMLQNVILISDDEKLFEGGARSTNPDEDFGDIDATEDAALFDDEADEKESMFG